MSCSAIYILDVKGKVLISRNYRGDIDLGVIEKFMPLLMEKEEEGLLTPILQTTDCTFAYIKTNNLYIVSTTKKNANIALVFVFLHKIVQVMTEYFKELEEESIRDNFVVIYELMDELLDFGYPQTTDSKILQEYITQEGHKLEIQPRIPVAVTNAVSWRSEGIKYRKNEVFLDVIESVNLLANANGNVLRSEIVGAIKMRVYLSGMPELRLGLNDKVLFESTGRGKSKSVELEDVKFHQCVRLSRFEIDRTISFIPPDGEFELMSYRLNTHVKPLIWIESIIERHAHSRVEYMIKAKSQFKRRSTANNVEIVIPVPHDADSPKFKTTIGSVKYAPEQNAITWTIKSFPGGKEYLMRAHFGLPSVECEDTEGKPPIQVKGAQRQVKGGSPRPSDPFTVQGRLEMALKLLRPCNEPIVTMSSRTDAGVHAINSTCHVDLHKQNGTVYDPHIITACLNKNFKKEDVPIRVLRTCIVPQNFHCGNTFDVEIMKEAAKLLEGWHDFRTFMTTSRGCLDKVTRKYIEQINIVQNTDRGYSPFSWPQFIQHPKSDYLFLDIYVKGKGFLYKQVRRSVASLVAVAQGKVSLRDIKFMLEVPSRHSWCPQIKTVPAHGLYLCQVEYSQEDQQTFRTQPPEDAIEH
nr:unnamed protein product [Callosobruchus analis]